MTTILIIDDEASFRTMLRRMLEVNGYAVLEAGNGDSGLMLLSEEQVDLVVSDIVMPEKEGIETIREIKALYPQQKVIAVSGGGQVGPGGYLQNAVMLGADCAMKKPFGVDELLGTVKGLLACA
ncbi:MAG: response regulator [Deltaproteobacteria bacterium]|nr:response regulator [Deltaproteobacteria bacterium]